MRPTLLAGLGAFAVIGIVLWLAVANAPGRPKPRVWDLLPKDALCRDELGNGWYVFEFRVLDGKRQFLVRSTGSQDVTIVELR